MKLELPYVNCVLRNKRQMGGQGSESPRHLQLSSMSQLRGQSATYRAPMSALRNENEQLSHKVSDLAQQIAALQGREVGR